MKNFLFATLVLLVLASCKDKNKNAEPEPTTIPVTGRIMDTIANLPFANTDFILFHRHRKYSDWEVQIVPFTTDSIGHFSTEFNIQKSEGIMVCWPEYLHGMSSKARIEGGVAMDKYGRKFTSYDFGVLHTSRNF